MTAVTPNQGITIQVGTDPANLPGAQVSELAGVENRLVQRYTNEADRTARNPAPNIGELSFLAAETRYDTWNGTAWISAYTRGLFAFQRRTTDAVAVNNSIVLVNDTVLTTVLPAVTGVFAWRDTIFADGAAAADIRVAYTWPGGGSAGKWGGAGGATSGAAGVGDGQWNVVTASGTSQPFGLNAVGSQTVIIIEGDLALAGTGGSLVLQYAQQAADVSNMVVRIGTRREIWRTS